MTGVLDRRSVLGLSAAGVLGAAVAACGTDPGNRDAPAAAPADRVMIIRHAEDPTGPGAPFGVTESGEVDSRRSLTVRGWTRAGALVALFDPRTPDGGPAPTRTELSRPAAIFAHDPGVSDSRRSFETVTPLAAALNLRVDHRFTHSQTAELAGVLSGLKGSTLVAWRHEEIGQIIGHLGAVQPEPPRSWPEKRYDVVYVLTREATGWRFAQVPQMLLAGDQVHPIV